LCIQALIEAEKCFFKLFNFSKDLICVSPIPISIWNREKVFPLNKELNQDLGVPMARHGFLKPWAEQGVFLLNNTLTVEAGKAGSHKGQG